MIDACSTALREAVRNGASDAEVFGINSKESEVVIESNDLKQSKAQEIGNLGIRVLVGSSQGFSSVNVFEKEQIIRSVKLALKLAKISPADKFNSIPLKTSKISMLKKIYDKEALGFEPSDNIRMAKDLLSTARSYDNRVTIDSGNFTSSLVTHTVLNSCGINVIENISLFSWSLMGMAVTSDQISNLDVQIDSTHFVKDIDVISTAKEFAKSVINCLGARNVDSFRGEMILSPFAFTELFQDVIAHSINSTNVQKKASKFKEDVDRPVATSLLNLEDDPTNINALGASSFDREGVNHQRNLIIEKGILKGFIYDTYTANKDNVKSTGNAGGSPKYPPMVTTTNMILSAGNNELETLISEIQNGIIINRFSGTVNPVDGDFSGVVKGGYYVKAGNIICPIKELMVAGNSFEALRNLTGVSKETKTLPDSILPYTRFSDISFTASEK
ncbi:MAG TPA: TldD/PmbA family protein [Candidatus Nitrosopolaris sp.]|nr:TldD/PmbA family protein [Candidatus Nitrosopolaris sp.]